MAKPRAVFGSGEEEIGGDIFRIIFERSQEAIGLSKKGIIILVNPAQVRLFGYDRADEVIGRPVIDLIAPEERISMLEFIQRPPVDKGTPSTCVTRGLRKDGAEFDLEIIRSDIEVEGESCNYVILRDITEYKKAEAALIASETKFKGVFQGASDALWLWALDEKGMPKKLIDVNDRAPEMLGYTRGELMEMVPRDLVAPEFQMDMAPKVKALQTKGRLTYEMLHVKKDGTRLPIEITSSTFELGGQKVTLSIVRDITDRKRMEDALQRAREGLEAKVEERTLELQESEARYRQLFNSGQDYIMVHPYSEDQNGVFFEVNDAACEKLGYSREELLKMTPLDLDDPESETDAAPIIKELREKGHALFEQVHVAKDGTRIPVEVNIHIIDFNGDKAALSISRDLRERKLAEEKFKAIFENAADAIFITDMKGRFMEANQVALDRLGYTLDELRQMTPGDIDVHNERHKVPERMEMVKKDGKIIFEALNKAKDGRVIPVEVSVRTIDYGGQPATLAISRDITQRKMAEKALKESEAKFRNLFESSTDAIHLMDLEGNILDCNRTACERLGYSKEEMLGMHVSQLDSAKDAFNVPNRMELLREKGHAVFEAVNRGKDGTLIDVEVNSSVVEYGGRKVVLALNRDITERKKAEESLMKREKQLSESQHIAKVGSWEYNTKTNEVFWSDELFRLIDLDPEKNHADFDLFFRKIHPDDRPKLRDAIGETLKNRMPFNIDYRFQYRDGTTHILNAQAELIPDEKGDYVILSGTGQDITDRKKAEKELKEYSERLEVSLAEKDVLLKEVHHRVKNNMQVISSLLNLQKGFIKDKEAVEIFNDSQNRIRSMALVHESLYRSPELSNVKMKEYIKELTNGLMKTYRTDRAKIVIKTHIDDVSIGINSAVPCGLILNELVSNSLKHAFPDESCGEILIKFRKSSDGKIEMSVWDNGVGVPETIDIHNTETLGLELVKSLTMQLKGEFDLRKEGGTEFVVTF